MIRNVGRLWTCRNPWPKHHLTNKDVFCKYFPLYFITISSDDISRKSTRPRKSRVTWPRVRVKTSTSWYRVLGDLGGGGGGGGDINSIIYSNMYAVLLCFVLLWLRRLSSCICATYQSIFFIVTSLHQDNHTIASVPAKNTIAVSRYVGVSRWSNDCPRASGVIWGAGIILWMRPTNEIRCYIVTSSFISWVHTQMIPATKPCACYMAYIVVCPFRLLWKMDVCQIVLFWGRLFWSQSSLDITTYVVWNQRFVICALPENWHPIHEVTPFPFPKTNAPPAVIHVFPV